MNDAASLFRLNSAQLARELDWLETALRTRIALVRGEPTKYEQVANIPVPELTEGTPYADFCLGTGLGPGERLLLVLALAPLLRPGLLHLLAVKSADGSQLPDAGGYFGQVFGGIVPTVDSALFLLAGQHLEDRLVWREFIRSEFGLVQHKWLRLEALHRHEPETAALIRPSRELEMLVLWGELGTPEFGADFPAEALITEREWEELVLSPATSAEVQEVLDWMRYEKVVMDELGLRSKVAPGFRALFYGPPGTGKTFTTSLLGKVTGRPVFRIDLSMVVSKYIGETEKNLRNVFDRAEQRNWILFFDEADALFGKRTSVSDAKDRFANQEVSYLLQRIESHDGMVILATNHRDNLDKAFTRRFQLVVHFPMPNPAERLRLWEHSLPAACGRGPDLNLPDLADRYELSGGSIVNVVRYCVLQAARREETVLRQLDFLEGVRREYRKLGRIIKN